MIKLILAILVAVFIFAFGIHHLNTDQAANTAGQAQGAASSAGDSINGAKNAVQQTQDLQNKLNSKAADQLNN